MKPKSTPTVIERFMLPNPMWQEGYQSFHELLGKPLGWMYLNKEDGGTHMVRLDRKGNCTFYSKSSSNAESCEAFLHKYSQFMSQDEDTCEKLPSFYKCAFGKNGAVFALRHMGRIRGLLILCALTKPEKDVRSLLEPFNHFLQSHVELSYKTFELNNFYETIHPRALALSTMHSVHRVISSSLRLSELLPRIGRLSAQVLKAKGCSIMLCDTDQEHLIPYFSFGAQSKFMHSNRSRIGWGIEGRIAKTGEFHLSRNSIGVPFIEEDVVGVMMLWEKMDGQPFTKTDLEILKSVSEQAVVAIKNAKLYEETEQLTIGSIKTINELLELNVGFDRTELPVFRDLVLALGRALQLSSRELIHLERAILLVDTGALAVPDKVWTKKGKLTKKEYDLIKRIPMQGANLLRSISSLKPVTPIILHYRERYDGKGYPAGLKGEHIPIGARIVAVVDSFLAMISVRSYREPLTIERAAEEIRNGSGVQYDPHVVQSFLEVIREKELYEKLRKFREQKVHEAV